MKGRAQHKHMSFEKQQKRKEKNVLKKANLRWKKKNGEQLSSVEQTAAKTSVLQIILKKAVEVKGIY